MIPDWLMVIASVGYVVIGFIFADVALDDWHERGIIAWPAFLVFWFLWPALLFVRSVYLLFRRVL